MKHYFTLITAIATFALMMPDEGNAQQTYVPDDNFEQALIDLGLDSAPLDNYVPTANIDTLTTLYVEEKEISDLTGIEDFIALKKLHCYDDSITSLDMSNCKALEELDCYRNGMTSLNVNNCVKLENLRCYENELSSLNLDDCIALEFLNCKQNALTTLDLRNCPVLEELVCIENSLTSINTDSLTALKYLYCYDNEITSLNVSTNSALYDLQCNNNAMTTLNASGCADLDWLFCSENALTSINISNCTSMSWLICSGNQLTSLNVSTDTALVSIMCNNNLLTSLDVSKNTGLMQLICHDNELTSLNLKNGNNVNMQGDEEYTGMDARSNPNLECIQVDDEAASNGYQYWYKDATAFYSEDCSYSAVDENLSAEAIVLYPNPAANEFQVSGLEFGVGAATIELYDLNGRKLLKKPIPAGSKDITVNVSHLQSGLYFCRIQTENGSVTKKLIIQNK